MNIYLTRLLKRKFLILFSLLFSFLIGFFITESVNYFTGTIECQFTYQEKIDIDGFITKDRLEDIKESASKYDSIDVDKIVKEDGFKITNISDDKYMIETKTNYFDTFYLSSKMKVSTRGKTFITDYLSKNLDPNYINYLNNEDIIEINNISSPYLYGLVAMGIGLLASLIYSLFVEYKEPPYKYDYINTFPHPFNKGYWKGSLQFFKSVPSISLMAMLLALMLISKLIILPSGFSNLGLGFGYIFFSISCYLLGPVSGLITGFLSDTLGYIFFDTSGYGFFVGYIIQAMITGLIYGLFFYKSHISFKRVLLARMMVSLISNILIGGISFGIISNYTFDQTLYYMLLVSLPKQLIYLIPQSLILFWVFKACNPLFKSLTFLPKNKAMKNN